MECDFISIKDLTLEEIEEIFTLTHQLKRDPEGFHKALEAKTLALIFEKPSNRTYVSFSVGMYQLGGNSIYLGPEQIKLGIRESIKDVAQTLSRYVEAIALRTSAHENVLEMARFATVPVINGLSELEHPCQALADIYTLREKLGDIKGKTLSYIGDGNNVCNSLMHICSKMGMNMNVAAPLGYEPHSGVLKEVNLFHQPQEAVKGADVIYTDVWVSMGHEKETGVRKKAFGGFQINKNLTGLAKKGALIMHCLPAHRGEEITDEVIDSDNSIVFDQAENRMHVQKAILIKLMGDKK